MCIIKQETFGETKISIVKFLENDSLVLVVANDYQVKLWNYYTNQILWNNRYELDIIDHNNDIYCEPLDLVVMNDKKTICLAVRCYGLLFIDYFTGKLLKNTFLNFKGQQFYWSCFSNDKHFLGIIGDRYPEIDVLDIEQVKKDTTKYLSLGKATRSVTHVFHTSDYYGVFADVRFSRDDKLIFAVDNSGCINAWSLDSSGSNPDFIRKIPLRRGDNGQMWAIDVSDSLIITTSNFFKEYGQAQLWNYDGVSLIKSFPDIEPLTARRIKINQQGDYAVVTGDIQYVIIKITREDLIPIFKVYFGESANWIDYLNSVDFSINDKLIALGIKNNVFIFNIESGEIVKSLYSTEKFLT